MDFSLIASSFGQVFSPLTLLYTLIGAAGGILIGSIPGLTATMGIALLVPFTYGLEFIPGVAMLLGIFCGGMYGGSISAILIHTPGTPSAAATLIDGYPMTQKGQAGLALSVAMFSSFCGGVIGALVMWYCWKLSQYKGISVMLVWVLAICLIYYFITSKTVVGRYFYAVGGNEKATKLSGIDTNRIYFLAYTNLGFLAGLCGLLCLARVGSVSGATGTSFEMDAIASCFIGGASAYGGSGTVGGVVIGALLLGVLNMGMSILGITDSWQYVVKGGVLLVAVIFDVVSKRKKS